MFAAGALLAVADSNARAAVSSVSSVSGGSIASAVSVGGFAERSQQDPDPMGRRVRLLGELVRTRRIATERILHETAGWVGTYAVLLAVGGFALVGAPDDGTFALTLAIIAALVLLVALFGIAQALTDSWYSVQAAVETLVGAGVPSVRRDGMSMSKLREIESSPTRIFCATDLNEGTHAYITSGGVVHAGVACDKPPNVHLADVVAASACFPGFRPIEFRSDELYPTTSKAARIRPIGARILLGFGASLGVAIIAVAIAMRVIGPLDGHPWTDAFTALFIAGAGYGILCIFAACLPFTENVPLVDGGVYDNLGAAFTLLAEDPRYAPSLENSAGMSGNSFMIVVDAGKPFSKSDQFGFFWRLVPLRLRAARRSVIQLIGNANGTARKQVITQTFQSKDGPAGRIVSIEGMPELDHHDDVNWEHVRETTSTTPTTLDALDWTRTWYLVLHGYRMTHEALRAGGWDIETPRTATEIKTSIIPPKRVDASNLADQVVDTALLAAIPPLLRSAPLLGPIFDLFPLQKDRTLTPTEMADAGLVEASTETGPDAARLATEAQNLLRWGPGPYARLLQLLRIGLAVIPLALIGAAVLLIATTVRLG
jgi:hypothetical protein